MVRSINSEPRVQTFEVLVVEPVFKLLLVYLYVLKSFFFLLGEAS